MLGKNASLEYFFFVSVLTNVETFELLAASLLLREALLADVSLSVESLFNPLDATFELDLTVLISSASEVSIKVELEDVWLSIENPSNEFGLFEFINDGDEIIDLFESIKLLEKLAILLNVFSIDG
jgi:hypothetical protein